MLSVAAQECDTVVVQRQHAVLECGQLHCCTLTSLKEGCWLDPGDHVAGRQPSEMVDWGEPAAFRQTSQKCNNAMIRTS